MGFMSLQIRIRVFYVDGDGKNISKPQRRVHSILSSPLRVLLRTQHHPDRFTTAV